MRTQRNKPIFQPVKPKPGSVTFNHRGELVCAVTGKPRTAVVRAEAA